jgi:UDPglucose--hexose-1-phosphate uridylyltransferase
MAELRFDPLMAEWVMIASHRQARPQMPKDWCPFCPGSGNEKVPESGFDVLRYPNDFPALSINPPTPDDISTDLFKTAPSYGKCEVLLYSDKHTATLGDLSDTHAAKLSRLWQEVFTEFSQDQKIKYVFIFENRGEPVGVTMPHPHGQVYGYSYIPPKVERKLESVRNQPTLFHDLLTEEKRVGTRIIAENQYFTVYVPFYSRVAYGVHVTANRQVCSIGDMTPEEIECLGITLRDCARMYDNLFGFTFPYMMCMHNAPVNSGDVSSFRFHVEFVTVMRSATQQQFFASSETGVGAFCNPTSPEEKAAELKIAWSKIKGGK